MKKPDQVRIMPVLPYSVVIVLGLCLLAVAETEPSNVQSTPAQGAGASRPVFVTSELRGALHAADDLSFVAALRALTRDPETTKENLPALLGEAKAASDTLPAELIKAGEDTMWCWWHEFHAKGSVILARVADSVREMRDESAKTEAVGLLRGLLDEALDGRTPGVPAPLALRAYYCAVFYPPVMCVCPGNGTDDVILALQLALAHSDPEVQREAANLLVNAAHVVPSRREQILDFLDAVQGHDKKKEYEAYLERLESQDIWQPIPRTVFLAIQQRSAEELADWLIANASGGGTEWSLHAELLCQRVRVVPNAAQILSRLLSNPSLAFRISKRLATPIPETATAVEKEIADELIRQFQQAIAQAEAHGYNPSWAVEALARLLLRCEDFDRVSRGELPKNAPVPYARDRTISVLLTALDSKNAHVQQAAAHQLGLVSWLGADVARTALGRLVPLREYLEKTHDLTRPDSDYPFHGDFDERPEKYIHAEVVTSIRQAEDALAAFEDTGERIE